MTISGEYDIQLLDVDGSTELKAIDFGELKRGDVKRYPSSDDYRVKNTGDYKAWLSYTTSGFPTDVTVGVYISTDQITYTQITEGVVNPSVCFNPGGRFYWNVGVSVASDAAFDSYNPTLRWNGHDSSTG